jgi:hypothetical protein
MEELLQCVRPLLRFDPWDVLFDSVFPSPLELATSIIHRYRWERAMDNTAYVVHHTPGRVRLRIPGRRNDGAFFRDVEERLKQCASVREVRSNPETAGILVRYTNDASLMTEIAEAGLSELVRVEFGLPPIEPIGQRFAQRLQTIDRGIQTATRGQVDGSGLTLLALLCSSFFQIVRGREVFGAAVPLLWYAGQAINGALPSRSSS